MTRLCRVPGRIVAATTQFLQGLDASIIFVRKLAEELRVGFFGGKMCHDNLGRVLLLSADAFPMHTIYDRASPTDGQRDAFVELFELLRPHLVHTLWPEPSFGMTPNFQRWPIARGMLQLYNRWWSNVRRKAENAEVRSRWLDEHGCVDERWLG